MLSNLAVGAMALAVAAGSCASAASAGSWTPVEIRHTQPEIKPVSMPSGSDRPCVWTGLRGWHQTGWLGTWHACKPGPEWRYERRCWWGPNGVSHCRFYG